MLGFAYKYLPLADHVRGFPDLRPLRQLLLLPDQLVLLHNGRGQRYRRRTAVASIGMENGKFIQIWST